jgi:hypothetical protein
VNKLMLSAAIVVATQLLAGCAAMIRRTDPASEAKYDEMYECMVDAEVNTVRAQCGDRFKNVVISGEFEELTRNSLGMYALLRPRTDGSHMSCWLDGPQDNGQLAALNPGDMVTIKGSLHGVTKSRIDGTAVWATLEMRPCELHSVTKAAR